MTRTNKLHFWSPSPHAPGDTPSAPELLTRWPWLATFTDTTGRNLTHKAVIFQTHQLLTDILDRDGDGEARASRDVVSTRVLYRSFNRSKMLDVYMCTCM